MAVAELDYLTDANAARNYLESVRWPAGPVCPHCAAAQKAFRLQVRPGSQLRQGVWKCSPCGKQFTVTLNTLFEDSKLPLHKWLQALELLRRTRAGVSAKELETVVGITYKSAWKLIDRVRYAFDSRAKPPAAIGQRRPESLYPRTLRQIVLRLLQTVPERKHPLAMERAWSRLDRNKVGQVHTKKR
jgi:transposase-like protein